jgi:hypothetical protein
MKGKKNKVSKVVLKNGKGALENHRNRIDQFHYP